MTELNGTGYRFIEAEINSLTDREFDVLRRISQGSSDQDIARELVLSINTVKWHNRNIYAKLGVSSRTQALAAAIAWGLIDNLPIERSIASSVYKQNLPSQVSSFIGRETEIKKITNMLDSTRLLTLTGPGGVGKTRLGLQVAARILQEGIDFPDGIYFIELAPVSHHERACAAIVEGLKLTPSPEEPPQETLTRFLREQQILLLLDNFEHLLGAAPLVSTLLAAAPDLKVLATSREALYLSGEQLYPVPPLGIHFSQELFIQRARESNPAFDPKKEDLPVIDRVCTRLDRLPLAVELAAARMNLFSLEGVLDGLEDRFRILAAGPRDADDRHQNLWNAIDWSYDLLEEEEQILFRRLAVFRGSRSLDAVEGVCCFDLRIDVLEGLSSLLAKNLIRQEEGQDGQPRFFLLETVHDYIRTRLEESGEGEQMRKRHAEFFVALAEKDKDPTLNGLDQLRWLKHLKADHDNLRQVYSWSMDRGEVELALRLVGCLAIFWIVMGSFDEGVQWVKESLALVDSVPAEVQGDLYRVAGSLFLVCCGEHDLSKEMYYKALSIYTRLEDIREMGWSHVGLIGTSEMFPEERELALENLAKSIEYLSEVNDQTGIFQAWCNMGCHYSLSGDRDHARKAFLKSLCIARELEDPLREKGMLGNLGGLAHRDGDVLSACKFYKESLQIGMEIGLDVIYSADLLIDIASTELELGRPRRAVILLGAADKLYKLGAYRPQIQQYKYMNKIHESIRSAVDRSVFDQAWQEGQAMTPQEATAFALEELPND